MYYKKKKKPLFPLGPNTFLVVAFLKDRNATVEFRCDKKETALAWIKERGFSPDYSTIFLCYDLENGKVKSTTFFGEVYL